MTLQRSVDGMPGAARAHAGVATQWLSRWLSWRIGAIVLLAASAAALFWPTSASLLHEWRDTQTLTYTHGYLVLAICLWLLIRGRGALETAAVGADYRAAALLAVLSMTWLITYRAGLQLAHQVLLPLLAWVAVWAALGFAAARRCAFAFGFLYFAIPLWSLGNQLLQDLTVLAVRVLIGMAGISAYVVDNMVHIPAGIFEIAGGCSGLHFFVVALALAALYGELNGDSRAVRLVLLGLAAVVAMVSNWLRVFTIILAGHLTEMQHFLIQVDHYYFGWLVFALAIWVFFMVARRLPLATPSAPAPAAAAAGNRVHLGGFALVLAMLSIGPAWSLAVRTVEGGAAPAALPVNPGTWHGPLAVQDVWQPHYPGADFTARGAYRGQESTASAFVAVYAEQRQGKELVGYDNSLLGDAGFEVAGTRRLARGRYEIIELMLRDRARQPSLLWYHYRIGARHFTRGVTAQLYYGVASLTGTPQSRLIAVRMPCTPDCDAARTELADLWHAFDEAAMPGNTG